jgi:hypothetical protein
MSSDAGGVLWFGLFEYIITTKCSSSKGLEIIKLDISSNKVGLIMLGLSGVVHSIWLTRLLKRLRRSLLLSLIPNVGPHFAFFILCNLKIIWYYQLLRMCVIRWFRVWFLHVYSLGFFPPFCNEVCLFIIFLPLLTYIGGSKERHSILT